MPPEQAQNWVWSTSDFDDEKNGGRKGVRLTQAIPETDAIQFSGECYPDSPDEAASAILGYDTRNLAEGTPVTVEFRSDGTLIYNAAGHVHGTRNPSGISGVLIRPSVQDQFWKLLAGEGKLQYQVRGLGMASISRAGAADSIRAFTEKCASTGGSSG